MKKYRTLEFLLLVFLLCSKLYGDQNTTEKLSLDQAIQNAIENNNSLENLTLDQETATDESDSVKSFRYPKFSLNVSESYVPIDFKFGQGQLGNFPGIGLLPTTDIILSTGGEPTTTIIAYAVQPISQLYRINLSVEQLKMKQEVSLEAVRQRRQTLVEEVKQAYYGILRNQALISSLDQEVKTLTELDRTSDAYLANGVILKVDSLEVKTRLSKAKSSRTAAGNLLATQKEQLDFLMGQDILTDFEVLETSPATSIEIDLVEARRLALERRPEIELAKLNEQVKDMQVRVEKSNKIPDIAVGVANVSPLNFDPSIPKNFWAIGAFFRWDVFDYGRKSNAVADATREAMKAKNSYEDVRKQILIEVGDKFRKLQQSRDDLAVAHMLQDTAKENERVTLVAYQNGAALIADVLRTNAAMSDANNVYQQALLGFWTAKAEFERAIGEEK